MNNFDILFAKNVMSGELSNYYNKEQSDARYLQKSGGTLTGDVTTPVTQFTSTSLVTRQFVEDAIANITDYDEEAF